MLLLKHRCGRPQGDAKTGAEFWTSQGLSQGPHSGDRNKYALSSGPCLVEAPLESAVVLVGSNGGIVYTVLRGLGICRFVSTRVLYPSVTPANELTLFCKCATVVRLSAIG